MRIVDVCGFYTPRGGGVKTYIDRKLQAVGKFGHELYVIAPGETDSFEQVADSGYLVTLAGPVFPLDPRYRYFANEARLHAELDRLAPDFVECGTPWISADMVANWRGPAARALIMHLDVFATYPYRWLGGLLDRKSIDRSFEWFWKRMRRFGHAYDLVVCANSELGQRTSEGGVANVAIEPMGVEPGVFGPAKRDEAFRAQTLASLGLDADAKLFLGVGRHSPEKRWPMIVGAVTAVGYSHQVGLLIIGEGRDTPRIMRAVGGNPHIELLPPTRDRAAIARLMASSDLLIHGSESESFGMVAAEARASGLPVLVPDRGGTADQASDGAGWTYTSGNGTALAKALRDILEGDRLETARHCAARTAADIRTMDRHFAEMFARYETVVTRRQAA